MSVDPEHAVDSDLEHAVDSTLSRAVSAFGVPLLITVIGALGGIVLTDMRSALENQGRELQNLKGDLREMKSTLNNGLVWRLDEIERRINQIEQQQRPAKP